MHALLAASLLLAQAPAAPQQQTQQQSQPSPITGAPAPDASLLQAPVAGEVVGLPEAIQLAQKNNLDLKAAQAKMAQVKELSRKLWASYLPQLSVGGSYTRNSAEATFGMATKYIVVDTGQPTSSPDKGGTNYLAYPDQSSAISVTIQPYNQLGGQVQLSQALFAPALFPAIQSAYLAQDAAELSVENARREILFGVVQVYYGAVTAKKAAAVQRDLLSNFVAHEKDATVKVQSGAAPKVVLLRAQIDRVRAEEDVRRAQNAYESARIALGTMLGREPDFEVTDPPAPPPAPSTEGDLEKAIQQRPDVKAAKVNEEVAHKQKLGAMAGYLPTIGVNGAYRISNAAGFTGQNSTWAVTVGLNWNLFDGGLREANIREASAKIAEAEYTARSNELKARDEVRRAELDLKSAQANKLKAEEQARLARESAQLTKVSFDAGAATYIEVADANSQLQGAELQLIAETLNAQLSVVKLAKALGAFDPR